MTDTLQPLWLALGFRPVVLWSDLLIYLLFLSGGVWLRLALRREYWRRAVRQVVANRLAMLSFGVVCVYATVGLLDADIYGPSIPGLMGTRALPKVIQHEGKKLFEPLVAHDVKLMSIGFLLEPDAPVIWRGPMVHSAVRQLLGDTHWGDLDYLIVDLPPGTGDAQLTLVQSLQLAGAVIVTQPQDVALDIAIKALKMFRHLKVRILGILENMSYFICDHCNTRHDIFSHGGARRAAQELEVPFLGEVPLAPDIRESSDEGRPVTALNPDSPQAAAFRSVAHSLAAQVSIAAARRRRTISLRAV